MKSNTKFLVPALILTSLIMGLSGFVVPQTTELTERIRKVENGLPVLTTKGLLLGETMTIAERMEHYRVPGMSIAVINDYQVDWAKGYGVLEAGGNESVNSETIFQLASIGKSVTAAAALHFVDAGLLDLNEKVNDKLVSWKIPENEYTAQEEVTLQQLLSHTAGVTVSGFYGYVEGEEIPSLQQILDGMPPANNQPIRVDRVPRAGWRYSGGGYQIVQQLLEDVTGEPFNEIMQETILKPIGMTSSTYEIPLPKRWSENAATAHTKSGAPAYGKWHTYPERGAGGMWTTPTDVARFAIEIMRAYTSQEGTILSNEMVNQMLTARNWNGYGLGVYTFLGGRIFFHPGDNPPGYKTFMIALPKQGRGVVVMTNSAIGDQLITEIVLSVFTTYGIVPPTPYIVVLGFILLLVLVMLVVIPIAYLIHRLRMRKMDSVKQPLGMSKSARFSRTFAALLAGAICVLAVPYYLFLDSALQQMTVLPEADSGKPAALSLIEEGRYFARIGEIEKAMSAFADAQNFDPEIEISSSSWNELCWRGSVWGYAAEVMASCEHAAMLDTDNPSIFDSRGLAKALTGDYAGAIVDFEVFVEWTKKHGWYEAYGKQREEWIAKLADGENPFDVSTLDELRNQ